MKKLLALLVLALFTAGFVGAETIESPMYAKALPIQKITSHEKGYRVTYFTAHGDLKTLYIPLEWFYQISDFKTPDGFIKAEIVRGSGPSYPYVEFFWKDGKFHHLRLFVMKNYSDRSWGVVKLGESESLGAKFDPTKALDLQF
jgi:hypothetical protein